MCIIMLKMYTFEIKFILDALRAVSIFGDSSVTIGKKNDRHAA